MKIVRVTKEEFEVEDGSVFEHPIPLEEEISVEDFQSIYDKIYTQFSEEISND